MNTDRKRATGRSGREKYMIRRSGKKAKAQIQGNEREGGHFRIHYQRKRKIQEEERPSFVNSVKVTQENIAHFILQTQTIRGFLELIDEKVVRPIEFQDFSNFNVPIAILRVTTLGCSPDSCSKIKQKKSLQSVFQQILVLHAKMKTDSLLYRSFPQDQVVLFHLDQLSLCKGTYYIPVSFENTLCIYSIVISIPQLNAQKWLISQWKPEQVELLKLLKLLITLCLLTQIQRSDIQLLCGYQQFILGYDFIGRIRDMYSLGFPTLEEAKRKEKEKGNKRQGEVGIHSCIQYQRGVYFEIHRVNKIKRKNLCFEMGQKT